MPDLGRSLALKESRGYSVSVCLPALDEAETIGQICRAIRGRLMGTVPLVDELIVIDSGSSDDTGSIAAEEGAMVHRVADIFPELGPGRGKGDSLWRSLGVLSGDVVLWLDSDVRNFDVGFVTSLLDPLLADEKLLFVKAFYERPLAAGAGPPNTGGARVTELVARPLLQLFYPELIHVIQPLAGEYAAYRWVLEQLPMFTGYGVEAGLLIDIAERFGVDRIGQADLGTRIHRNRPTFELGATAFQVMHVMLRRFDELGRIKLGADLPTQLHQFVPGSRPPRQGIRELEVAERPPVRDYLGDRNG